MKRVLLAFTLLFSAISFAQINWMTMNQALEAQQKEPKKIMIEFYADWCPVCKRMDRETFSTPEIIRYINENYYPVKFNAEGNESVTFQGKNFRNPNFDPNKKPTYGGGSQHEFVAYFGVRGYPTTVFLDEKQQLLTGLVGYFSPRDMEVYLSLFSSDKYREIKTTEDWNNYKEKFNHRIKP